MLPVQNRTQGVLMQGLVCMSTAPTMVLPLHPTETSMASFLKRLAVRLAAASFALIACSSGAQAQVTAGPGAWSSNQTWAADTVNGGSLTGYFYWPKNPPTLGGKRALVLVLHGCTQTASGDVIDSTSDGGFNWKTVAEQYGAVILAPNATGNVYSNHCWDYASTS